ncbi:glycerate kinase [Pedobacter sp. SYSU D00535]|uniref:glycerate kinase n=1 Tax=Pedobacter sp. SYSU D00535 TaxID=2810308 RepID=UPI001A97761F|nr:glycerate kinase [Pedobacter sp. SYSU D00535]
MKFLIAPDKFKHSLSSFEAAEAITEGLLLANSSFRIIKHPLADGGDGFADVLGRYLDSEKVTVTTLDPLFREIITSYYFSSTTQTAVLEMAKASGLMLLKESEYNCLYTSSIGTGLMVLDAVKRGAKTIFLGLGGSATNDGGIGMASALGIRFLDKDGKELSPIGKNLIRIASIDTSTALRLDGLTFEIACDVQNPLTGGNGGTYVYSAQKGATEEDAQALEEGMQNYAAILKRDLGIDVDEVPGAGAAGGLGAGCIAFLGGRLKKGIQMIFDYAGTEERVKEVDYVITGEGKLDSQSFDGKVLSGLNDLCQKYQVPLVTLCGTVETDYEVLRQLGIEKAISVTPSDMDWETAREGAFDLLVEAARSLALKHFRFS